jgi:hypothetical protein
MDRRRAGGKEQLAVVGKHRLHSQGAAVHRQIFDVQAIFFEQAFLVGDSKNRMERRHAAAADADLVRRKQSCGA